MRSLLLIACLAFASAASAKDITLLNASYDPTRELYADYNRLFAKQWQERTGDKLRIRMAHGGSGAKARAIMEGLPADVATLALGADLDAVAAKGRLRADWEQALPHHAAPYHSIIVLLVRKGNPKNVRDWADLARPGIAILTPNPKSSGGARWNYLGAWAYAQTLGAKERETFMQGWIDNVLLFDTGARASTTNFVRRGQGDVLITWENEAHLAQHYFGEDAFEIIIPSVTMLAEPSVAVVDAVVDERGTRALAESYLKGLYEPPAQDIIAKHYFRPLDNRTTDKLPPLAGLTTRTIRDFGGWKKVQQEHFAEGGKFDGYSGATR